MPMLISAVRTSCPSPTRARAGSAPAPADDNRTLGRRSRKRPRPIARTALRTSRARRALTVAIPSTATARRRHADPCREHEFPAAAARPGVRRELAVAPRVAYLATERKIRFGLRLARLQS